MGEVGAVQINGREADNRAQHHLQNGDRILIATPGGGGYGSLKDRHGDAIARDRRQGYVRENDK